MKASKIRQEFSKRLRVLRKIKNLTQEELAEMVDISPRYYQMLESSNPPGCNIDTIQKLGKALGKNFLKI